MPLPYWVLVGGQPLGIMRGKQVTIEAPKGVYNLAVKLIFPFGKWQFSLAGEKKVVLDDATDAVTLTIGDRERWWNILFDIDLVLWVLSFFVTIPSPWNVVYHVLSDGFFILWAIRLWHIRSHYFVIKEISENAV